MKDRLFNYRHAGGILEVHNEMLYRRTREEDQLSKGRRSNGEGTLRLRADGRWECTLMDGYDNDGRRVLKSFYGKSQKQVKEKLKRYLADKEAGIDTAGGETPFSDWADFWFEGQAKKGKDPYAYFLGDDLFVCPVIKENAGKRTVHLPKGEWVHFWTGEAYEGGKKYRVDAPLGQIPVFYRKNSPFAPVFQNAALR